MQGGKRGAFGARRVVLARSLCRLKWFRLGAVPAAERWSALSIQALAWRPFDEPAYRFVVQGERGLVIAWDAAAADLALQEAGLSPQRSRVTPESVWWERPQDGVSLLACLEGFEGQVWHQGLLRASRWWPAPPAELEWRQFLHLGLVPDGARSAPVPEPEARAWLARPWAGLRGDAGASPQGGALEARVVAIGGLLLIAGLAGIGHQWFDVQQSLASREQTLSELKQSTEAVIVARDRALGLAAQAQLYAAWLTEPLPIEAVAHLHDALARSGVKIKELELTGARLRLGMQVSPQASHSNIVRDLQAGSWLKDVSEVKTEATRGLVVMDMRLDGLRPPPQKPTGAAPVPVPAAVSPSLPAAAAGAKPASAGAAR